MDEHEQIKNACYLAALRYFELDPRKTYRTERPVLTELPLAAAERAHYTHKFSVTIANRTAIVLRAGPAHYEVIGDEEQQEPGDKADEEEAYNILLTAAVYLEVDPRQARSLEARKQSVPAGAAYSARYTLTIDGLSCIVVRYDRKSGPQYSILVE